MPADVAGLVDAQARGRDLLSGNLLALLARLVRGFGGWYDDEQTRALAVQALGMVRPAQAATAGLTVAYLGRVLDTLRAGGRFTDDTQPYLRVVDDPVAVYERPAAEYRRLRAEGLGHDAALLRAEGRLLLLAETDLRLAMRDASRRRLAAADKVTGYRRVLRPELSRTGSCGLCIAASDRLYKIGDLLPIHERCGCEVMPVTDALDPGRDLNVEDLKALYEAAGSTAAADLKRIRAVVRVHGELGPILRRADHEFRGPEDVPAAA